MIPSSAAVWRVAVAAAQQRGRLRAVRKVIYLRVSTIEQTTANQERELREIAGRMGCEITKVYKDHVISGAKGRDKRPAFDALCRAATRREFDVVMAWSVDRLGRRLPKFRAHHHRLQQEAKKKGRPSRSQGPLADVVRIASSCRSTSSFADQRNMRPMRGCPLWRSLLGVKRTSLIAAHMSASDPKRTSLVAPHVSAFGAKPTPVTKVRRQQTAKPDLGQKR